MSEDFLSQSQLCSTAEKNYKPFDTAKNRAEAAAPLTAALYDVQHSICQFVLAPLPIPHFRIKKNIAQLTYIRNHAASAIGCKNVDQLTHVSSTSEPKVGQFTWLRKNSNRSPMFMAKNTERTSE